MKVDELVIGIDPGTASMGISILGSIGNSLSLVHYNCLTTPAKTPAQDRLHTLFTLLTRAIKKYKPTVMAVETLFFSKNVRTALSVAQARGIVLLTAAQAKIPVFEYNPQQIKQAVTGYGGADKRQIQEMVKRLLGLKEIPKPDDAADAIAIAICHLHTNRFMRKPLKGTL